MFDRIGRFIAGRAQPIDRAGPPQPPSLHVAACALLLDLAHADGDFSPFERRHIERALSRHFGLDEAASRELLALAEEERAAAVDHFRFTRVIASGYDLGQKMVLAEVMWGVILADGEIAEHEAYLVRKLANLLDLEPAYLSQARLAAVKGGARGPDGP